PEQPNTLPNPAHSDWESKPSPAEAQRYQQRVFQLAIDECLSKGVTTFQDAGSPFSTVDALKRMAENHELRMRIWMMLRMPNEVLAPKLDQYRMFDAGGGFFTVRAIKRQIDGALGSRGAWLLAPYTDKPDSSG